MRHLLLLLFCSALALQAQAPAPTAPRPIQRELLRVPTRPGVVQPCLMLTESAAPRAVALLYMGGLGAVHLERRSVAEVLGPKGNFLLRSAEQILSPELAVAIVDAPSDQASGMEDTFRMSDAHASDQRLLVAALRQRLPGAKVMLVGTSRGTISAAYLAQALGPAIDGVVLTSTVFRASKRGLGLSLFHFEKLKVPLLLVHHAEDGCPVCPFKEAQDLKALGPLITVRGSIEPESGPCDPLSNHGYFGRETAVAQALRHWILGEPFPREIP